MVIIEMMMAIEMVFGLQYLQVFKRMRVALQGNAFFTTSNNTQLHHISNGPRGLSARSKLSLKREIRTGQEVVFFYAWSSKSKLIESGVTIGEPFYYWVEHIHLLSGEHSRY